MASLNLQAEMWLIKEKEIKHGSSFCGQFLSNIASWMDVSLQFSY